MHSEVSFQYSLDWKDCFPGWLSPAPMPIRGAARNYSALIKQSISHKLVAGVPLVRATFILSTKRIPSMQDLAMKRNKSPCCQLRASQRMVNFGVCPISLSFLVGYENYYFRSSWYCLAQRQLQKKTRYQCLLSRAHFLCNIKNITYDILLWIKGLPSLRNRVTYQTQVRRRGESIDGKDKNALRVIYSLLKKKKSLLMGSLANVEFNSTI